MRESIVIIDFGGAHSQSLARRVRDLKVYCELLPWQVSAEKIKNKNLKGIILTGSNAEKDAENLKSFDGGIFDLNVPILAIGSAAQAVIAHFGGELFDTAASQSVDSVEFKGGKLLEKITGKGKCLLSRGRYTKILPDGFTAVASGEMCSIAAFENVKKNIFGVHFHLDNETEQGTDILKNFLFKICKADGSWTMASYAADTIEKLKKKIGDKKVLCALSGGVDSAVAAAMLHKAAGSQLFCILVDHGLMRKGEIEEVVSVFRDNLGMNLVAVDAEKRFLDKLKGVTEPEEKRKIIGGEFIKVFEEEAKKIGKVDFLVQGTIYPDIIESGSGGNNLIKSHHNVGGLPSVVDFKEIIEPLRDLFKDEVRQLGFELGLSESIVMRQPFPGPGLGIRIIGEVTKEKLDTLRLADFIYRDEIKKAGLDRKIWQYFAVLTSNKTVGVTDDSRTYSYTLALRGVHSSDGMTAEWAKIPYEVLDTIGKRIVSEVKDINRIVYDITSKPPATIEWE